MSHTDIFFNESYMEVGKQTKDCRILVSYLNDLFPIPPGKHLSHERGIPFGRTASGGALDQSRATGVGPEFHRFCPFVGCCS